MASWYEVGGVSSLNGEIAIQGSKNSVLPILAATILTEDEVVIHNCPMITDVLNMVLILESLGCKVSVNMDEHCVKVDASNITSCEIDKELTSRLRSSIIFLGALLARKGMAKLTYPGGCKIGMRPIDMHIDSLCKIGAIIKDEKDVVNATIVSDEIRDVIINLRYPSVGTTENIILASVLGKKRVVIKNAAKDPEISELINVLKLMGANICKKGQEIRIKGVSKLRGIDYVVTGDRIVAATYMAMVGMTGGNICMKGINRSYLSTYIDILKSMGIKIKGRKNSLVIKSNGKLRPIDIKTGPYPQVPTDVQPFLVALATKAEGISVIEESVFENRFEVVTQMRKFGADISVINNNVAIISGNKKMKNAEVFSCDLRAGAALVVMALAIEGETKINNIEYITRGYEDIVCDIAKVGGRIRLVNEEDNYICLPCFDCDFDDSGCVCI